MTKKTISQGTIHKVPNDLRTKLQANDDLLELWNKLTPLARTEWICWLTIVKKKDTRVEHLKRLGEELNKGKKRPCCWPGCPHRRPNAQKWFYKKK